MAMDVESVSTPPQGGRRRRDGQERWVKSSNTAEDEVRTCENSQRQHNGEKLDTVDAKKQMEESKNGMEGTGNDTGKAVSVDNNQESRTGMGRGTWERFSSGKLVQNETEKFTETGKKIVSVAEEGPTQMPGTTEPVREDPSTGEMVSSRDSGDAVHRKAGENDGVCVRISERLARCMTRAKKNTAMQERTIDVSKALQTLEQETPVVVDRDKLKVRWMTASVIFVSPSGIDSICDSSALLRHFFRSCWRQWSKRPKATRSSSWRNSTLVSARASTDADERTTKRHL